MLQISLIIYCNLICYVLFLRYKIEQIEQRLAILTRKKVLAAIPKSGGVVSAIAKRCKVKRNTMFYFLSKPQNADIEAMRIAESEVITDVAENVIIKAINRGETWAAKWWLSTKGKTRGFTEKQEIEHVGIGNIDIKVKIVE